MVHMLGGSVKISMQVPCEGNVFETNNFGIVPRSHSLKVSVMHYKFSFLGSYFGMFGSVLPQKRRNGSQE